MHTVNGLDMQLPETSFAELGVTPLSGANSEPTAVSTPMASPYLLWRRRSTGGVFLTVCLHQRSRGGPPCANAWKNALRCGGNRPETCVRICDSENQLRTEEITLKQFRCAWPEEAMLLRAA